MFDLIESMRMWLQASLVGGFEEVLYLGHTERVLVNGNLTPH